MMLEQSVPIFQQMLSLPNENGMQLLFYDLKLNLVDSILPRNREATFIRGHAITRDNFTIYKDHIYYRQGLNDTIFNIDKNKIISPEVVFDFEQFKMPELIVTANELNKKYMYLSQMKFTEHFAFFISYGRCPNPSEDNYCYQYILYDRSTKESFILGAHPEPFYGDGSTSNTPINDIDGLNSPELFFNCNNGINVDPIDILLAKEYYNSVRFDKEKLSSEESYNKVKKLLDESDIEDNPIIRICYLK